MKVLMMSLNQLFPTDEKIDEIKQLIKNILFILSYIYNCLR
jgi:hypothetical protein